MLILRRRAGESLLIGSDVEIEILDVAGSAVKIGIRAPKDITILRKELELTRRQNCAAALDVPFSTLSQSFPRIQRSHNSPPPR